MLRMKLQTSVMAETWKSELYVENTAILLFTIYLRIVSKPTLLNPKIAGWAGCLSIDALIWFINYLQLVYMVLYIFCQSGMVDNGG